MLVSTNKAGCSGLFAKLVAMVKSVWFRTNFVSFLIPCKNFFHG